MSLDKLIQTAKETNAKTAAPFIHQGGTFPLDQIQTRVQDTRSLDEKYVADLIESIAVLGLIEPLACIIHDHFWKTSQASPHGNASDL